MGNIQYNGDKILQAWEIIPTKINKQKTLAIIHKSEKLDFLKC